MAHAHPIPILRVPQDSFTSALSRLDPASRALLDLSLRRGMRPEEIGDLLGTDPESVVIAREGALEQLAAELDMADVSELDDVRTRLAELPAEAWTGTAPAAANGDAPPRERRKLSVISEDARKQEPKPKAQPAEPERRSRLPLLLAVLAVAAIALVIVFASSGGGDEGQPKSAGSNGSSSKPSKPSKSSKSSKPSKASKAKGKPGKSAPKPPTAAAQEVALVPLGSAAGATGSASLTEGGKRLRLDVSGLPDPHGGAYQVWLYDSVIDAVSLVKVSDTKLTLDLKLPANASHYRYVDISREPADGNPNHSGESILRVPLAKLSG
jgi:hypothetical protein